MPYRKRKSSPQVHFCKADSVSSSRTVKKISQSIKNDGNPICSGDNGYYYAGDRKELLASIGQMTSRIREIAKAKRGLVKALEHFPDANGQLRLDLDKEVRER